jgi:hypothetical protein
LRTRAATLADAAAIAAIYNEGIADRIATFRDRAAFGRQIVEWFTGQQLVMVAKSRTRDPSRSLLPFRIARGLATPASASSGLRRPQTPRPRGGKGGPCRADRSGYRHRFAQAHQPRISGKHCKPSPFEGPRFRGNRIPAPPKISDEPLRRRRPLGQRRRSPGDRAITCWRSWLTRSRRVSAYRARPYSVLFSGALLLSAALGPAVGRAIDNRGGRGMPPWRSRRRKAWSPSFFVIKDGSSTP